MYSVSEVAGLIKAGRIDEVKAALWQWKALRGLIPPFIYSVVSIEGTDVIGDGKKLNDDEIRAFLNWYAGRGLQRTDQ
jgi:hypothetical protein